MNVKTRVSAKPRRVGFCIAPCGSIWITGGNPTLSTQRVRRKSHRGHYSYFIVSQYCMHQWGLVKEIFFFVTILSILRDKVQIRYKMNLLRIPKRRQRAQATVHLQELTKRRRIVHVSKERVLHLSSQKECTNWKSWEVFRQTHWDGHLLQQRRYNTAVMGRLV